MEHPPELPHYRRLRQLIDRREAPLVVLHGWPGAGVRGLLAYLSRSRPEEWQALSAAAVESIDGATELDHDLRYLIVDQTLRTSWRPQLEPLIDRLLPHQCLVVSILDRELLSELSTELAITVLGPRSFLLELEEAKELAQEGAGEAQVRDRDSAVAAPSMDQFEVEAHYHRTGGWLEPFRFLLDAATGEERLEDFVAGEVLAGLPLPARSWLSASLAGRPPTDPGTLDELSLRLLVNRGYADRRGLAILPPLLFGRPASLFDEAGVLVHTPREGSRPIANASSVETSSVGSDEHLGQMLTAPGADYPRFEVKLLGVPSIESCIGDSRTEIVWSLKRAIHLLALLCSRPGLAAGRDEVIEALWPDEEQDAIERNLHPTVSLLRRALRVGGGENPILLRNGIYRLSPSYDWSVDAVRFERSILTGRASGGASGQPDLASWEDAWRMYSGPFMVGHDSRFISDRREELQRLYMGMLRDLGDAYFAQRRHSDAEDAFRSILNVDPIQESVHISIMEIYADRGRRDLVRKQYERLCTLLQEELGVDPLPATATEYHRLMS